MPCSVQAIRHSKFRVKGEKKKNLCTFQSSEDVSLYIWLGIHLQLCRCCITANHLVHFKRCSQGSLYRLCSRSGSPRVTRPRTKWDNAKAEGCEYLSGVIRTRGEISAADIHHSELDGNVESMVIARLAAGYISLCMGMDFCCVLLSLCVCVCFWCVVSLAV